MAEQRGKYLDDLVNRAMNGEESSGTGNRYEDPGRNDTQFRSRVVGSAGGDSRIDTTDRDDTKSRSRGAGSAAGRARSTVIDDQYKTTQTTGNSDPATGKTSGGKAAGRKGKNSFLKGLISGTVISDSLILKDIRYSALIMLLAIVFIANRFNAERMEREISALEQEVSDLRAEALSVSADLGSVSRQSEITDLVKERGLGLEELREPPYRIVVNE